MKKRFIDTNIFLRFLTADIEAKYENCRDLFKKVIKGKEILVTSELVIAEVIWTLLSYYKLPKEEVVEKVLIILNTPNIEVDNHKVLTEALLLYKLKNIDFIDAYNAILMKNKKVKEIFSYDKDFDKVEFLKRIEP